MKKPSSMFMFGMRCVRCDYEIIAPHRLSFWTTTSSVIYGTAAAVRRTSSPFRAFGPRPGQ